MRSRLFRSSLIFALLFCLSALISLSPMASRAGASSRSLSHEHNFQPNGHGFAIAHKVSTVTIPQTLSHIHDAGQGNVFHRITASTAPTLVSAPQNILRVPPASGTDPSAIGGIGDNNQSTADANGAGGTDNYLETANSSVAIFSRSGALEYTTTFQKWFSINTPYHDPKVVWDNTGNRFIFSVNVGFALILSVAQQTDALGNFCNYALPTPGNYGADFDMLGVNGTGIFIGANLLNPGTGKLVSNEMFFADRIKMENCAKNAPYTSWTGLTNPDGTIAEAIVPANEQSSAGGVEYLVNSIQFGGCQLTLWTLVTSSIQLSNASIPTQCYTPPTLAKQKGSSLLLGTGQDNSLTQASYLHGLLTVALPSSYNWGDGNGTVTIIEWFVLIPGTASLFKQGSLGTPGYWLFFPSVVMNSVRHMIFVYNVSGPNIYPSIWYVNQTFSGTLALVQGTGPYQYGKGAPWGYYSSAWLDMSGSDPNAVWITGEYAQADYSWGTEFGLVTP